MCDDKRPQLSPSPVEESKEQSQRKHENEPAHTHVCVQETTEDRRRENRDPHAMPLQCLEEIAALQRFLEDRIHDADENQERERQFTDAMEIHRCVKDLTHQEAQNLPSQPIGQK